MITIAMGSPALVKAAIFVDDTAGNAQPTAADNGETTIIADGGTSATPFVTIGSTVNLNGDNAEAAVLLLSNDPYTVNIAGGGILAANSSQDGINSTTAFTLNNSGLVSGFDSNQGIDTVGGLSIINNSGSIFGADDAVRFTTDGGTVNNLLGGLIDGTGDAISDGIDGLNDVSVTNNGDITGTDDGIDVDNDAVITNATNFDPFFPFGPVSGGSITGGNTGIEAGDGLLLLNQNLSTITGTAADGINAGNSANITNQLGGTILGGDDGVDAGDDLTLNNAGTITGTADDGVEADDDANITNSGTIIGGDDGINADDDAIVTNSGTITGGTDGIDIDALAGTSTVTNSGTITGGTGDAIDGSGAVEIINNSGVVQAGTGGAIDLFGGDDTINLNFGSQVIGDVDGGTGDDTLTFDGGLTESGVNLFGDTPDGPFSNSILGDVDGIETVNKTGGGVAFIGVPGNGGFDVNADTINITGGGLYINADINAVDGASLSTINAGGAAIGGTGVWNADVNVTAGGISAGAIPINLDSTPTNSVGGVTITGDVVHSAGSFIRFDVNPQGGGSDLITQTGAGNTYELGGADLRISSTDNDRVISDGVYTVVDSDEVITGAPGDLSVQYNDNVNGADGGLQGSEIFGGSSVTTTVLTQYFATVAKSLDQTDLELTIAHDYAGLPGLNSNQASLGAALDASVNSGNTVIQDFISALDNSDLATVDATLASVIPDNVLGAATAIVGSNYRLHRVVEDHLAMTRSSGQTVIETPATTDAKGGMIPAQVTSVANMGNVWGTVSYDWRDSDFGTTDIDGEDASITVGIDYRVTPDLLLGVLFDGSQSDYDYSGGSTDTDSYRFALYGTYGQSTGFYADFLVGYGDHDLDTSRSLGGILGGFSYDASTDAESLQALLTVGYAMESGCVKHGPFAGLEYQNIEVDGFAPSGFGAFGGVDDFDIDSLRLLVGYRAQASYDRFTPFGQVAYAHEFEDGPVSTTATIPGGATFGFEGGGVESAILVTLGTGYTITDSLSATLAYHGEFTCGDGIDSHGASLGLNYSF